MHAESSPAGTIAFNLQCLAGPETALDAADFALAAPEGDAKVIELLNKALRGARIVVLPGNHDEFLREYLGTYFGEVEFVDRTIHTTALVTPG